MMINKERLSGDLRTLRGFTATPGQGVTRFSYRENDKKAREYIFAEAKKIGCEITSDALQNVIIKMPGDSDERRHVIIGSHVDTVRNGGPFDGIYGVMSGLEVLRSISESNTDTAAAPRNLRLVIFAEEEGSNFGSTMTGSKFISGKYTYDDLFKLKTPEGRSLDEVLDHPSRDSIEAVRWNFSPIDAMLELHIEQGPVLDREGLPLAIVDTIFGMQVIRVELDGLGNHAGASPMSARRDALCAASQCILATEEAACSRPGTVATAGTISVEPDCSNVIPGKAVFTIEARSRDNNLTAELMDDIKARIRAICESRQVSCNIEDTSSSGALGLNRELIKKMDDLASSQNIPHKVMDSGAVHDACMIAAHAPTGMIFVPSIDGRSHVPEENTDENDLFMGAQFLLDVTQKLLWE